MVFSFAACGEKKDDESKAYTIGVLEYESADGYLEHLDAAHPEVPDNKIIYYNNLSSALMDLVANNDQCIILEESVAAYIASHNDSLTYIPHKDAGYYNSFSMAVMEKNQEVYDLLNNAIVELKANGTLDSLVENRLKAYIESEPVTDDLPKFDGAKTIKIGVTGDLPPMDFIASNGKAAGFNVALLAEISKIAHVNIELVQIETGARAMALSSGKVDAIFWSRNVTCPPCNATFAEGIPGTLMTESYFSDSTATVAPKHEK